MSENVDPMKSYLGDSVYVQFDGYHFVLTTENGYPDDPRNLICLEPDVYQSLVDWVERLNQHYSKHAGENQPRTIGT